MVLSACSSVADPTHDRARTTCAAVGPLACPVAPIADLDSEACLQLRSCLQGRSPSDGQAITRFTRCDPPAPENVAPAELDPIEATATMGVELELDGPPSNAVYLFLRDDRGWCPAAELLEPLWQHGGYCESNIQQNWTDSAAAIRAERVCHMPLDGQEFEAGVSDVAEHECVEVHYAVVGGSIQLLSKSRSDGACPPP